MSINSKSCGDCANYDPILKGKNGAGVVETKRGRCVKFSTYPHKEGPGQKFPPNAVRVDNPGDLASVKVVEKTQIVPGCKFWAQKREAPTKAGLRKKVQG
jgi:hypothetical protein